MAKARKKISKKKLTLSQRCSQNCIELIGHQRSIENLRSDAQAGFEGVRRDLCAVVAAINHHARHITRLNQRLG